MPSNFGVTPIDPSALLKLLENQLQSGGTPLGSNRPGAGLADRGFLSMFNDEILLGNPPAPQFATIKPTSWPVWQSVVDGVGSTLEGFNWTGSTNAAQVGFDAICTITCFAQISSDPETKDTNAVSEEALGVTSFVTKVCSAVHFWAPKDTDGNDLLREYARIQTGGLRWTPITGAGGPWLKCAFDLQMRFTALLPALG